MEFENNTLVSDAERLRAEAKRLTLQPVHTDVTPDAPLDSEIATRHIIEPPLANTQNDTEESASYILPTKSLLDTQVTTKPQIRKRIATLLTCAVIFTSLAIFAVIK